jgi:hypothetical protein
VLLCTLSLSLSRSRCVAVLQVGWAMEQGVGGASADGSFRIQGNSRAYLVRDHAAAGWAEHSYVRFDLHKAPLRFTGTRADSKRSAHSKGELEGDAKRVPQGTHKLGRSTRSPHMLCVPEG